MGKYFLGKKSVIEAINKGTITEVHYKNFFPELSLAKKKNIKLLQHSDDNFFNQFNTNHQFVIGFNETKKGSNIYESFEEFFQIINITNKQRPLLVMLDSIQDPGNFGAICRTCESFAVDGIIIKKNNQVDVNDTVIKTSLGSANNIPILKTSNLVNIIEKLKSHNFWVFSTSLTEKSQDIVTTDLDFERICLILGNENKGVNRLVLDNSDLILKIPMLGDVQSLNVSVSAGILLFCLRFYSKK